MFSTDKKSNLFPTSHKMDPFELSTPKQQLQRSNVLHDSQRDEIKNRGAKLFSQHKKENDSLLLKLTTKNYTKEQLDLITDEHRMEIQKLLLEISRLHDVVADQDKAHQYELDRLKEDFQHMNFLQLNNLKQNQINQNQIYQSQIRKLKEALNLKQEEYQDLQKNHLREKQNLIHENTTLKSDLKQVLENKNAQILSITKNNENQLLRLRKDQEESVEELKDIAEKQMKKVLKKLQQQEEKLSTLKNDYENKINEGDSLQQQFEEEKSQLQQKINRLVDENKARQLNFMRKMEAILQTQLSNSEQEIQREKQSYKAQIQQLFNIIKVKDYENERNLIFRQTEKMEGKYLRNQLQSQIKELKNLIFRLKSQQIQEMQSLKVKMGLMHENDLKSFVQLYQTKIQGISREQQYREKEVERLNELIKVEGNKRFQMKKKYDITISKLLGKINQMKTGLDTFEKDLKDKSQNQKSMLMITSHQLIKTTELKNNNIKFYQEELRKLRQLLEIQANEVEESERNVEEKIKLAEDELNRLSNKILQIKGQSEVAERKYKITIQQKNKQIDRLNELLLQKDTPPEKKQGNTVGEQVLRLEELLNSKEDQLRLLRGQVQDVNERNHDLKAENERLFLEGQINTEDARKHFKSLADKNLTELKKFYERRLKQLEEDKRQLQKINTSQTQHITELILKYKELEKALKDIIKQSKKRGELQSKIVNLGLDQNLVKNMAQLFHK